MENNQELRNLNVGEAVQTEVQKRARVGKRILLAALIVCSLAILGTGTLAYFTAEETAYNVITTGELSMDLIEETTDGKPWPTDGLSGLVPGSKVDKIPYVVNDGGVDFYTRIAMTMKMTAADGTELSTQYVSLDINTADWTEKDGYYYYNKSVAPGEKTAPLFTTVSFDTKMDNSYMNARLEIEISAQAVQSKNNGAGPLDATGWSEAK